MDGSSGEQRLAETYDAGRPGLPRGRSRLPEGIARDNQKTRLLRSIIAAVARKGYAATTVADVVAGARVSRREFYEHFADKRECFLAAALYGGRTLSDRLTEAYAGLPPRDALRVAARTYLTACAEEPEFTRCFVVELAAAGEVAVQARAAGFRLFGAQLRDQHLGITATDPPTPAPPVYVAAAGAITELVYQAVAAGDYAGLPRLEDTVVDVLLRMLAPVPD